LSAAGIEISRHAIEFFPAPQWVEPTPSRAFTRSGKVQELPSYEM
jgi:hypothetical protein